MGINFAALARRAAEVLQASILPATLLIKETQPGQITTFKYAPSDDEKKRSGILQSDNLVAWQGVRGEEQTGTVDVFVMAAPAIETAGTGPVARLRGTVRYGSGGVAAPVQFDVGARFTVSGNHVEVLVEMLPPPAGRTSATVRVGACLGFFAAPSQAPVTLTEYVDDLAAGATTDPILRPLKSVALLPVQLSDDTSSLILTSFDHGGGRVSQFLLSTENRQTYPLPLAPSIGYMTVKNTGGVPVSVQLPFQLAM